MQTNLEIPRNALTGAEYQKGNVLRLLAAAADNGYNGPLWAGYKQWLQLGRVVRKGQRATSGLTVITVKGENGKAKQSARGIAVFHYDQTEELQQEEN